MALLKLDYNLRDIGGHKHLTLSLRELQKFNSRILDVGSPDAPNKCMSAMAAFLDLEGFTSFCSQIDSQLVVPAYLRRFHEWLFAEVSARFTKEMTESGAVLWGKFPFFAKFLGDGILLLWDMEGLGPASLGNIVVNLFRVRQAYTDEFLPQIECDYVTPPPRLRCGIARGEVISIGGGKDFVGSCINLAARLQHISALSFALARRGFDPAACFSKTWQEKFSLCKTSIRGIGDEELVFVCKDELAQLPDEDRRGFVEVNQRT